MKAPLNPPPTTTKVGRSTSGEVGAETPAAMATARGSSTSAHGFSIVPRFVVCVCFCQTRGVREAESHSRERAGRRDLGIGIPTEHVFGRVEQLSYKRSSGQAAISWLRGDHSAPHVGGWRNGYRANFLPAIFPSRYAISYPIWSSSYPSSYPISYSMAVSSQEADFQWCGPKCGPRCGITRVQTKERPATRARCIGEDNQRSSRVLL
jgi:hypothetical protein